MRLAPIYRTDGEWVALLQGRYLYNTRGEWIGWLEGRDVYSRDGEYVGYLSDDQRVLRTRIRTQRPLHTSPPVPPAVRPPATVPLPPLFAELPWQIVDVFDEDPRIFDYVSDLRPDWDGS
jgi:hypothetical protein